MQIWISSQNERSQTIDSAASGNNNLLSIEQLQRRKYHNTSRIFFSKSRGNYKCGREAPILNFVFVAIAIDLTRV